jgi:hypothetical protein
MVHGPWTVMVPDSAQSGLDSVSHTRAATAHVCNSLPTFKTSFQNITFKNISKDFWVLSTKICLLSGSPPISLFDTLVPWPVWHKLYYFQQCWNFQKLFLPNQRILWRKILNI